MDKNKIWFRRKLYGWGWTPCTWEGWLVILLWVIFFALAMSNMDHEWLKNLLFIFLSVAILILICYKKGEKPKWQWGERKEDLSDKKDIGNNLQ
ncbi:MAG: hypothetical protein WCO07_02765 [bacterium]